MDTVKIAYMNDSTEGVVQRSVTAINYENVRKIEIVDMTDV